MAQKSKNNNKMNMNMPRPSMLWIYGLIGLFIIGWYLFDGSNEAPLPSDWTTVREMVEKGEADAFVMDDVLLFGLAANRPNPAALKVVGKDFATIRVAVSGAGAAGVAVTKFLQSFGVRDAILCDSKGVIYKGRAGIDQFKSAHAIETEDRTLSEALRGL